MFRVLIGIKRIEAALSRCSGSVMTRKLNVKSRAALVAVAIACPLVLAIVSPAPASATMYVINQPVDFHDSSDFTDCGLSLHDDLQVTGTESIRTGTGKLATAFFDHFMAHSVETITNSDNGKFVTIEAHFVSQDVKATPVSGSIFQFVTHLVGQPFVLKDMNGRVISRDRGNITFTYLFDTGGDQVPGGTFIVDVSDPRVSGPHPAFFADPLPCDVVVALIG